MNANGSGQRRLTRTRELELEPSWSPRGDRIAFLVAPPVRICTASNACTLGRERDVWTSAPDGTRRATGGIGATCSVRADVVARRPTARRRHAAGRRQHLGRGQGRASSAAATSPRGRRTGPRSSSRRCSARRASSASRSSRRRTLDADHAQPGAGGRVADRPAPAGLAAAALGRCRTTRASALEARLVARVLRPRAEGSRRARGTRPWHPPRSTRRRRARATAREDAHLDRSGIGSRSGSCMTSVTAMATGAAATRRRRRRRLVAERREVVRAIGAVVRAVASSRARPARAPPPRAGSSPRGRRCTPRPRAATTPRGGPGANSATSGACAARCPVRAGTRRCPRSATMPPLVARTTIGSRPDPGGSRSLTCTS